MGPKAAQGQHAPFTIHQIAFAAATAAGAAHVSRTFLLRELPAGQHPQYAAPFILDRRGEEERQGMRLIPIPRPQIGHLDGYIRNDGRYEARMTVEDIIQQARFLPGDQIGRAQVGIAHGTDADAIRVDDEKAGGAEMRSPLPKKGPRLALGRDQNLGLGRQPQQFAGDGNHLRITPHPGQNLQLLAYPGVVARQRLEQHVFQLRLPGLQHLPVITIQGVVHHHGAETED